MASSRPLEGSTALVTGAAQGMGRAIATRLAADGARVAANDIGRRPELDELVSELGAIPAPADVSDREQVRQMVSDVEEAAGPIGILVSNAAYMTMHPFLEHPSDDWWKVVNTNLTGTFHLVQAVLPGMRRLGHGRIVIISSYWGVIGWRNSTAYAASKSGLVALTKTLARELAPEGIIVNAIAPGITDTPQLQVDADDAGITLDEMRRVYAEDVPLRRIGRPQDIAAAVALLVDPALGAMVGQTLQVNGGEIRCRV
jgi:NAD(P)-dependent dehydrogenase (short-subunit alcohol dehydrogenase family)